MFISINGVKDWEFETTSGLHKDGGQINNGITLIENGCEIVFIEEERTVLRFINDVNKRIDTLKTSNFDLAQDVKDACEELGKAQARIRELEANG